MTGKWVSHWVWQLSVAGKPGRCSDNISCGAGAGRQSAAGFWSKSILLLLMLKRKRLDIDTHWCWWWQKNKTVEKKETAAELEPAGSPPAESERKASKKETWYKLIWYWSKVLKRKRDQRQHQLQSYSRPAVCCRILIEKHRFFLIFKLVLRKVKTCWLRIVLRKDINSSIQRH